MWQTSRWRVGAKLGRTIYAQIDSDETSTQDVLLGMVETREIARFICDHVNRLNGFTDPPLPDQRCQAE